MWGNIAKNAQALASIAAEQAQKGLASANQLLEKLDGQMEGEGDEEDDDEYDEESPNEDGSRRERRANEESKKSSMVDNDTEDDQDIYDAGSKVGVSDSKVERSTSLKESMLESNPQLAIEHVDNSIDDELDQLLLDDEAADAAERIDKLPSNSQGAVTSHTINTDSNISPSAPVNKIHSSKVCLFAFQQPIMFLLCLFTSLQTSILLNFLPARIVSARIVSARVVEY
jgi:hypothetical protein